MDNNYISRKCIVGKYTLIITMTVSSSYSMHSVRTAKGLGTLPLLFCVTNCVTEHNAYDSLKLGSSNTTDPIGCRNFHVMTTGVTRY